MELPCSNTFFKRFSFKVMPVKFFILSFFSILTLNGFSQSMNISGSVMDTSGVVPLENAVVMAIRINDSLLMADIRTDIKGHFALKIPIDTVEIIISFPKFSDKSFFIFGSHGNSFFDFGKIALPPKTEQLKEIVIYAFKDPIYYKGDTLIYAADSFKVKPNASVEDLLKKLPGINVDQYGKITSEGTKIDQVLVDGDEFFGSDPTMATKNLNANTVESIQVYDKKDETSFEAGTDNIKVLNLKLKADSKKGYFGKIAGAGDVQKFYEGEVLANKFKDFQKISIYAHTSNTPQGDLTWEEFDKYGMGEYIENGVENNSQNGFPKNLKSGIYYLDRIGRKTKLGLNYNYDQDQLMQKTDKHSQYFLTDTSYTTNSTYESQRKNESHFLNLTLTQTIDSLTELIIQQKLKYNILNVQNSNVNDFITSDNTLKRRSTIENNNNAEGYNINTNVILKR